MSDLKSPTNPPPRVISIAQALGTRGRQEDRFAATMVNGGDLLMIADGHGPNGAAVAARAVEALPPLLASFLVDHGGAEALGLAMRKVIALCADGGGDPPGGSTLSAVFIPPETAVAHVAILGDSPVVIAQADSPLWIAPSHAVATVDRADIDRIRQTCGDAVEFQESYLLIKEAWLQVAVTRALGDPDLDGVLIREAQIHSVPLSTHTAIVIGSDGILPAMANLWQPVLRTLGRRALAGESAEALLERLPGNARRLSDNTTLMVWRSSEHIDQLSRNSHTLLLAGTNVTEHDIHVTREDMAESEVSAFFAIVNEWGLSQDESRTLLGKISHGRFNALQMGDPAILSTLSEDELDRLAYITGIYAALNILYIPESHPEWLRNESRLPAEAMTRPWGTGSPLKLLLTGKFMALADVYAHLNAMHT